MDSQQQKGLDGVTRGCAQIFWYAVDFAQRGDKHDAAKVLKGFGGAGVLELVEDDQDGTYRAVYTVKFGAAVFVLHCFNKKSKQARH